MGKGIKSLQMKPNLQSMTILLNYGNSGEKGKQPHVNSFSFFILYSEFHPDVL